MNEIFIFLFGTKYEIQYYKEVYFLQMFTTIFILYKQGFARVLIVKNKMWFTLLSNFIWATIVVLGTKYFIDDYGVLGVSFSIMIAYIVNIFFFLYYYAKLDIIPLEYIYSKRMFILWLLVIMLFYIGYEVSLEIRIIIMLLFLLASMTYIVFRKKYEKKI